MKKIAAAVAATLALGGILTITSLSFVNYAVELGFLTGVGGQKLITIPLSGGVGVALVNLIPIAGLLTVVGAIVHAASGISWGSDTGKIEG